MSGSTLPPALVLAAAIVAGSAMDASIKYLQLSNGLWVVVFTRYAIGTMFSLVIWAHAKRPVITREMWGPHILRGVVIAGCATTFFWALRVLPLAEAVTLSFIYPLMVPFMAWPLLGERIRASSVVGAILGFAGVIVAMQGAPAAEDSPLHTAGVIAVRVSAALFSLSMVLLRSRAQSDGAPIVGLMTSLVPGVILAGPALALGAPPSGGDWPVFILMGALAAVFMYLMARAYAMAETQQLAPIHYTELVWASVFGYILFQDTPRLQVYAGAALIIGACLWAAYDERRIALAGKDGA